MTIQVIYFDLGNVLLSFSHEQMCRQMADVAGVSAGLVYQVLFGSELAHSVQWQFEMGQLDTAGYFDYFCQQTGTWPDRRRLEHAACDIFQPMEATAELVRRLAAAGNRMAIFSNINPPHWHFVTDGRFPVLSAVGQPGSPFAWAVLSYEAKVMKPERRIYDVAIQRASVPADRIFFVDDREENVAGAQAAGIDAVQFVDCDGLIADLRKRGVEGI